MSGSLSAIGVGVSRTPALLIRMSRRPRVISSCFAAASTLERSLMSRLIERILGVVFPASWAAWIISCSTTVRLVRAPMAMADAPALAKEMAVARPMPLLAPLTETCHYSRTFLLMVYEPSANHLPVMKMCFPERLALAESMAG